MVDKPTIVGLYLHIVFVMRVEQPHSANTALDGMVHHWDNAFTFVLPAVSDGGGLASETREPGGRLAHLTVC